MKRLLLLLLIAASYCHVQAQNAADATIFGLTAPKPNPLKCEKYQHVYHVDAYTGGAPCNTGPLAVSCVAIAVYHPEVNECVDDMHEMTERDWQELMHRLKALEEKQSK